MSRQSSVCPKLLDNRKPFVDNLRTRADLRKAAIRSDCRMTQLQNIEQLESDLWAAADQLRANSKLTSSEYCMPVLGIIFLRHATNRYDDPVRQIAADQAAGKMPKRPLQMIDFKKRRALLLPREARY